MPGADGGAVGQLVGIGIRSFFLVAVSAAAVVLPFWGRLEFSSDWGKLIYTLASIRKSNGFYSERLVEFRFHYEILLEYTPLELMGLTILLCTLILTLLGLLMFFEPLLGKGLCGGWRPGVCAFAVCGREHSRCCETEGGACDPGILGGDRACRNAGERTFPAALP